MFGPSPTRVQGGVATGVGVLLGAMPEDAPSIRYVPTNVDGSKAAKTWAALAGFTGFVRSVVFGPCEIVHVKMSTGASFARKASIVALSRLLRKKVVIQIHGSQFDVFFKGSSPLTKAAIKRTLASADLVIALSESWRTEFLKMSPSARVRVLANSVVVGQFSRLSEERPGVPERGGRVLFLGAFCQRKGIYDLVDAMEVVISERPAVVFELGGDQQVEQVRRLISDRGLTDNVKILGWVRGDDKLAAFSRSHILVLPSYHEGLPNAILEALAAGLPVVSTPAGAIPEVVEDGVNGLIVKAGDAQAIARSILRLLDDESLRKAMRDANIARALRMYDSENAARTLCEWYDEVMDGTVGGAA
jgi:glycosyltransferase involved in cell wall biosynthesis